MEDTFKQSYKMPPSEMTALSVYNVGHQRCTPRYQWGPGVRKHYLIHYVVSGCGVYETRGQRYSLQAGEAFLALPATEITYYADENDPWEYVWVGFAGNDALPILQCTDFAPDRRTLRLRLTHTRERRESPDRRPAPDFLSLPCFSGVSLRQSGQTWLLEFALPRAVGDFALHTPIPLPAPGAFLCLEIDIA